MNAELVVKAIVEIGKADEASLPQALQELADSLSYRHAAIVEATLKQGRWVPMRTVCHSREFTKACRAVTHAICQSKEPVRVFVGTGEGDLSASMEDTHTYSAAGVHLDTLCTPAKKTVLMLVTDDRNATLSELEKRLLSTISTLVCKGLAGQELELPSADDRLPDALGNTLGIVSHDLRNPVGTILGYTELLLASRSAPDMPPEQRHAIGKIRESSLFMLQLLGDLLESTQIDCGKISLSLRTADVSIAVAGAVDRCRMAAEKKQIQLVTALERPCMLASMDPHRIGQVLDNLITNGIKFSRTGTTVRVGANATPAHVEVWVEDEGQGIPDQEVPNLFKKFSRTSTRPTAGEKSTGLGLFIVGELVKLHGGTVRVDTAPGRGSRFTFTLTAA